jgi:predicted lysophospholipase L1 biosynthesis ABC-type transport system permease subunit
MTGKQKLGGMTIALGAALGAVLGAVTGQMGVWLAVGVAIGVALGASMRRLKPPECEHCAAIHQSHAVVERKSS